MHVGTSTDLKQWTKEPGEPLLLLKRDVSAAGTYDTLAHWRDPHVFWNPGAEEWWLAVAAHEKTGLAYPYAGADALATSTDLRRWTVQPEPLLASRGRKMSLAFGSSAFDSENCISFIKRDAPVMPAQRTSSPNRCAVPAVDQMLDIVEHLAQNHRT